MGGIRRVQATRPDVRDAPAKTRPQCRGKLTLQCEASVWQARRRAVSWLRAKGPLADEHVLPPPSPECAGPSPALPSSCLGAPRARPRHHCAWKVLDGKGYFEQRASCTKCRKHFPLRSGLARVLPRNRNSRRLCVDGCVCVHACVGVSTHVEGGGPREQKQLDPKVVCWQSSFLFGGSSVCSIQAFN